MPIEDTRHVRELRSIRELNLFLAKGWKLILSYVEHSNDTQRPRFVVAWQSEGEPVIPELLDAWELNEIDRQRYL
ncbi:MAG: hypothetical protein ACK4S4_09755 [Pyrinomonadaceae bacterium]